MSLAERTRPKDVDRFWRQVESDPHPAYAYVSLLGLRTYETAKLHSRVREGLSFEAFERIGDTWVDQKSSPILRVPSPIVPEELNFLAQSGPPRFR